MIQDTVDKIQYVASFTYIGSTKGGIINVICIVCFAHMLVWLLPCLLHCTTMNRSVGWKLRLLLASSNLLLSKGSTKNIKYMSVNGTTSHCVVSENMIMYTNFADLILRLAIPIIMGHGIAQISQMLCRWRNGRYKRRLNVQQRRHRVSNISRPIFNLKDDPTIHGEFITLLRTCSC